MYADLDAERQDHHDQRQELVMFAHHILSLNAGRPFLPALPF
jgi:hypothetical protein